MDREKFNKIKESLYNSSRKITINDLLWLVSEMDKLIERNTQLHRDLKLMIKTSKRAIAIAKELNTDE